jgi:hypothetical protein
VVVDVEVAVGAAVLVAGVIVDGGEVELAAGGSVVEVDAARSLPEPQAAPTTKTITMRAMTTRSDVRLMI